MNKSKKAIKSPQNSNKKQFTISPIVWIVIGTVLGLALLVGLLVDQFYKSPLVTIDGKKYYLEDMTYQFYSSESTYDYINQLYGGSYWDMPYSDTSDMTVRDFAKVETINNFIYEETLYNEAISNGYTLTQDELDKINDDINSTLNNSSFSDNFIKKNGFTQEYLKDIFTRNTLATRFKKDVIDAFDIDDESIKAGITYNDYRQYNIEYLSISTKKTNEVDSSQTPMEAKEKQLVLDIISDLRDKALNTEDWATLIPEDDDTVRYRTSNFTSKDTYFSEDLTNIMMGMGNGDITEVIEEEDGYYVVRMINNNSSEAYDKAVDDAIKKVEEESFTKEYTDNILPNHTYELNSKAISNLRMGRITLVD